MQCNLALLLLMQTLPQSQHFDFQRSSIGTDDDDLLTQERCSSAGSHFIGYGHQVSVQKAGKFVAFKLYFFYPWRAKQVDTGYGKLGVLQTC